MEAENFRCATPTQSTNYCATADDLGRGQRWDKEEEEGIREMWCEGLKYLPRDAVHQPRGRRGRKRFFFSLWDILMLSFAFAVALVEPVGCGVEGGDVSRTEIASEPQSAGQKRKAQFIPQRQFTLFKHQERKSANGQQQQQQWVSFIFIVSGPQKVITPEVCLSGKNERWKKLRCSCSQMSSLLAINGQLRSRRKVEKERMKRS